MQIRQLQHFEALYRLRSFVQAAQEHEVTQSALSRSLQKLETDLDQRLFDRTTHAVEPTAAAEVLIARARDVIDAVAAFEEEAERQRGGASGHVRIGTGPYPRDEAIILRLPVLIDPLHQGGSAVSYADDGDIHFAQRCASLVVEIVARVRWQ